MNNLGERLTRFRRPPQGLLEQGQATQPPAKCRRVTWTRRSGKVLMLVAIAMPAMLGMVGLVYDASLMMADHQNLQQASDSAATAAALDLLLGKSVAAATATATNYVQNLNHYTDAQVTANMPPLSGKYAGQAGYAEIISTRQYSSRFMQMVGGASQSKLICRAVAGYENSTAGAAIVVLDSTPPALTVNSTSLGVSYPAIIGGLEVLGVGSLKANGAVLVNTAWGGVDQNGNPAGSGPGPPYGISCTPLLSLTKLQATDIRVVGGVDNQNNYGSNTQGQPSPLVAGRMPVSDPYQQLSVPCTASDPVNVKTTNQGGVQVTEIPLIIAPTILNPGVYDWIEINSGYVTFNPGIYIITGVNPLTNIGLNILGGFVTANGVLFYVTNTSTFNPSSGAPDSGDGNARPATPSVLSLNPSVLINAALPGSSFTPLQSGASPFNGMLIYQRRQDFRPIVVVYQNLLGSVPFQGAIYAKWGHFMFIGDGTLNLTSVSGSASFMPVLGLTLSPSKLLPAAQDVYLVE